MYLNTYYRLRLAVALRAFFTAVIAIGVAARVSAQTDRFGRILDKVVCEADPTQAYALYIPSYYSNLKKWPLILCFDPKARGQIPVERLKAAAESYGYIIAGSLNSRNGPWSANAAAVEALLKDLRVHLTIDPAQLYTAGLSGGARVATSVALAGVARGVIACSAGFPELPKGIPAQIPFAFFGTAGTEDFNYTEMMRLDAELDQRNAAHRLVVFDGKHEWASAELLTEAVEWLDLHAMQIGTRPRDNKRIDTWLRRRVASLPGRPAVDQWKAIKSIVADFQGLAAIDSFAQISEELGRSRDVKKQLQAERLWLAREDELIGQLGHLAQGDSGEISSLARALRRKADQADDTPERRMVRRVISSYSSIARETAGELCEKSEYEKAIGALELADTLRPNQPRVLFDLARAHALSGDKKAALRELERAATAGFNEVTKAENDPAFSSLRNHPAFQATLAKIRGAAAHPAIEMAPVRISAVLESVELRPFYLSNPTAETPLLSFLRVEAVRPGTTAAEAGVEEGMEVTSIQGRRIRGMTDAEVLDIMGASFKNEIVITVHLPPHLGEREIHIPLRRSRSAVASQSLPVFP